MEKDKSQQAKELLSLIDTLYDEKTRHKGLIDLSEKKSEVELRTLCIYNSFGIVTILQQEILSAYKYLDNCNMPDEFEIRICNALTILRSIAGYNEIAINLASSHLLYFMCPLIETNNPRFSNIRKVGIAVFVEVTSGNKDPLIYQTFVDDGILNVCLSVIERVDLKEKGGIMLMLNNILCFDISFCEKLCNVYSGKICKALEIYENEIKKSPQETAKLKDCIENIRRCIHVNEYNGYTA